MKIRPIIGLISAYTECILECRYMGYYNLGLQVIVHPSMVDSNMLNRIREREREFEYVRMLSRIIISSTPQRHRNAHNNFIAHNIFGAHNPHMKTLMELGLFVKSLHIFFNSCLIFYSLCRGVVRHMSVIFRRVPSWKWKIMTFIKKVEIFSFSEKFICRR